MFKMEVWISKIKWIESFKASIQGVSKKDFTPNYLRIGPNIKGSNFKIFKAICQISFTFSIWKGERNLTNQC